MSELFLSVFLWHEDELNRRGIVFLLVIPYAVSYLLTSERK